MSNASQIRKFALEIIAVDDNDIIKTAGIIDRIKNFIKDIIDPNYRAAWQEVYKESDDLKQAAENLSKELETYLTTIKNRDIGSYPSALNTIRESIQEFSKKFTDLNKDYKTTLLFGIEEYKHPGFTAKWKQYLPKGLDIDKETPLSDIEFLAGFKPQDIEISPDARKAFLSKVSKLSKKTLDQNDQNELINNLKQALVNGILIEISPRKPAEKGTKFTKVHLGTTILTIKSAPFTCKALSGLNLIAKIMLIDWRTAQGYQGPAHWSIYRTLNVYSENKIEENNPEEPVGLNPIGYLEPNNPDHTPQNIPDADDPPGGWDTWEPSDPHNRIDTDNAIASRLDQLKKMAQGQHVPIEYTNLTEVEFANILREGYKKEFGEDPSAEVLGIGWSQAILECGSPVKLPCNNVGNQKATSSWIKEGNNYFTLDTSEYNEKGEYYSRNKETWRAFDSPVDGAAAYWEIIGRNFKEALEWMKTGDVESSMVSMGIKDQPYYTYNIRKYTDRVTRIYNDQFLKKIKPQLSNIKSVQAKPPGEKPEIKDWRKDYSSEEKQAILGKKNNVENKQEEKPEEDMDEGFISPLHIDELIRELLPNAGPLSSIVTSSIIRSILPKTDVLIYVNSKNASYSDKLEYARVTSNLLRKIIKASATITGDKKDIEIQCSILGTEQVVEDAVQAICDYVAKGMLVKTNKNINPVAMTGLISKYASVEYNHIISNYKVFTLKRVASC